MNLDGWTMVDGGFDLHEGGRLMGSIRRCSHGFDLHTGTGRYVRHFQRWSEAMETVAKRGA